MATNQTTRKQNDLDLWNSIRNGDKDSLSELFKAYYPGLFNFGFKIIPREQFIKDCIQELFLAIWEQRNTISEVNSVKSYLYVSMKRMVFSNLKKYRNYQNRNVKYAEQFPDEVTDFETWIITQENQIEYRVQLYEALQVLSSRQKEVIHLKYKDGLSNSEIASLLEINRQSVYNHVSESLKQIKCFIQDMPKASDIESPLYSTNLAYS